jgi:hypothetical protein
MQLTTSAAEASVSTVSAPSHSAAPASQNDTIKAITDMLMLAVTVVVIQIDRQAAGTVHFQQHHVQAAAAALLDVSAEAPTHPSFSLAPRSIETWTAEVSRYNLMADF